MFRPFVGARSRVALVAAISQVALLVVSALAPAAAFARPESAQPGVTRYTVTDLGMPLATAINDRGDVVGQGGENVSYHAALWRAGVVHDLGTLPHDPTGFGVARDVNDLGEVVGIVGGVPGGHAFRWHDGVMTDLGWLGSGFSDARAINAGGYVVGAADSGAAFVRAVAWTEGGIADLGFFGVPLDVNAAGSVVGSRPNLSGGNSGFLYEAGIVRDLPTLGGTWAGAFAINADGEIAGGADIAGDGARHAVVWRRGLLDDLGTLRGDDEAYADGINDVGHIVGGSSLRGSADPGHAWVTRGRKLVDLNRLIPRRSGWTLVRASGINNEGQIVGSGIHAGTWTSFLLTPVRR